MRDNYEVLLFKYLDQAVEWEKDKQEKVKKASKPFKKAEITSIIEDYELSKLKSTSDCVERMKMIKILRSAFARRMFLMLVRENFENIDFSALIGNKVYKEIKDRIFKEHPDLTFVEDDKFLRQIGNAFAHGNYIKLFDMEKLEKMYITKEKDEVAFNKKDKSNLFIAPSFESFDNPSNFNDKSNNLIVRTTEALKSHKVSPAHFLIGLLSNNRHAEFSAMETLKFKYESNLMLDENGDVVRRPSTAIFDLEITREDLEVLTFMLIAQRKVFKYIGMERIEENQFKTLEENTTNEDAAKFLLATQKFYVFDETNETQTEIELDEHQKEIFICEYVDARKWFGIDFFSGVKDPFLQDIWATNQNSHVLALNSFFCESCQTQSAVDLMIEDVEHVFDIAKYTFNRNFSPDLSASVASFGEYIYQVRQIFNSYTESLITELLLLFQVIEDRKLSSICENSSAIRDVVSQMDQNEIISLRCSPKYRSDERSILGHLRNSLSHLNYLNNLNEEIFIYDYVSKRNKERVYKFTISIENLEKIKDELLTVVCDNILTTSQQDGVDSL